MSLKRNTTSLTSHVQNFYKQINMMFAESNTFFSKHSSFLLIPKYFLNKIHKSLFIDFPLYDLSWVPNISHSIKYVIDIICC